MTQPAVFLEFPMVPDRDGIEPLRESLAARLTPLPRDRDHAMVLTMVASELLENAVKSGRWSEQAGRAGRTTLRIVTDGGHDAGTVTYPIDPERPGVPRLLDLLRELASMAPGAACQLRLRALQQDPDSDPSGLGLARMSYEAGRRLSAWVTAASTLHVHAQVHR